MAIKRPAKRKDSAYVSALKSDGKVFAACQNKFWAAKSSQQRLLESLLAASGRRFERVADVACGNGALSHHLSELYPKARFTLIDLNDEILDQAKAALGGAIPASSCASTTSTSSRASRTGLSTSSAAGRRSPSSRSPSGRWSNCCASRARAAHST